MKLLIAKTTFVAVVIAISAAGCNMKAAHEQAAATKWEKTLEQARLAGARQSIEMGKYDQARLLLKPLADNNNPEAIEIIKSISAMPEWTQYAVVAHIDTEKGY